MDSALQGSGPFTKPRMPMLQQLDDDSLWDFGNACHAGDLQKVTALIEDRNRPLDYINLGLCDALGARQMEVSRNSVEILQLLLDYGWNVNDAGVDGEVALPYAVHDETLVRWLLDRGADPNLGKPLLDVQMETPAYTKSGQTLNRAAEVATIAVFDLLLETGAKLEYSVPLHFAAACRKPDVEAFAMINRLLELGVDVNSMDDVQGPWNRGTPLHYAATVGRVERVRFLLEKGADPQIRNLSGRRPLEQARKYYKLDVVEFFKGRM